MGCQRVREAPKTECTSVKICFFPRDEEDLILSPWKSGLSILNVQFLGEAPRLEKETFCHLWRGDSSVVSHTGSKNEEDPSMALNSQGEARTPFCDIVAPKEMLCRSQTDKSWKPKE